MEENVIASIKRILEQWFTNIDDVRESEKHWFNCKTALKTTLEFLRKHPQILLKRDDANKGTSQDFSRWLVNQLLRLLGQPSCSEIHGEILKVTEQILANFSAKSNELLCEVIEEIVSCLLETANIRYDLKENEEYSTQNALLLFSGRTSILSSRTTSTICVSTCEKCDAVLTAAMYILDLYPYSGARRGRYLAILRAARQIIEVCEPPLKSAALHLTGNLILERPPPASSSEFINVMELTLYLLECEDSDLLTSEVVKSTSRLLTIALSGSETWDLEYKHSNKPFNEPSDSTRMSWMRVAAILDSAARVLALETSNFFTKWIVECVCFIYSEWDITRHELRQKTNFADESIQGCLAETDPVIRTNRTSELLPLLLKQHTLLGDKILLRCVMKLLDCSLDKRSIVKDNGNYKIGLRPGSPKKKAAVKDSPLHLLNVMFGLLEAAQLGALDEMSGSNTTRSNVPNTTSIDTLAVVWRCLVHTALKQPMSAVRIVKKAEDVVSTLETVQSDAVYSASLTVLGHTLLLYFADKQLIPQKVKAVAKKLLDVNIKAISDENRTKVLQCYVFLGSFDAKNVRYFIDPLSNPNGKASVFPLIQLFSQMEREQITECIKCLANIETEDIRKEVATYLDQIILAYLGKPLTFIEKSLDADLFGCIIYQDTGKEDTADVKVPSIVIEKLLLFLDPSNPPTAIVQALDHVTILCENIDREVLLGALIPLILHDDLNVRTKLANNTWSRVGDTSASPSQNKGIKFTETQKKILCNLKMASNHASTNFKKTGLAIAMTLACRAGFDFCRELIRDIINELVDDDVTIQVYVITGLPKIASSRGLKSTVELFERFSLTICETLTKKILQQHDAVVTFIEEVSGAFFGSKHRFPARYFLIRYIQHVLPIVFQYGSLTVGHGDVARTVLQTLSEYVDQTVKKMVVKNFPHIFCYIARSSKDLESPFSFVESVSGMTLSELMQCNTQPINNQLVLYLRRDREAVVWGLSMLEANTTLTRERRNVESSDSGDDTTVAKLIEPKLLGILASLSAQQLGRFSEESYLVMESVIELLQIFPSETIGKWKNKFISILRNGLTCSDKTVRFDSLRAWQKFAEVSEGKCIAPLLGEIVAVLLPHLNDFPSQVIPTIKHLLLEQNKWSQIKEYVGDIGWLMIPDHPELADVKTFFNRQVRSAHSCQPMTEDRFKDSLKSHINGMTSESCEVRAHALHSLQLLLHQNQQMIHDMVLGRETVDSVITELISTLLCGVRDSDPDTRILFCTCLGEVGAVDAGLLDSVISTEISKHKLFMHGIDDENFGPELLISLTKGYRNSSDQLCEDKFAFAIQAVLSAYRSCGDVLFKKFSDRFDESVMEILEPHRNSKYILKSTNYPEMTSPVYRSETMTTFNDWLTKFTSLLLKIVGEESNDQLASLLIEPLNIITTTHTDTVQFLLPILVLQILLKGAESAVDFVLTEIQAVLYATQSSKVKCDITKMIAQTVFSLIDYVMIWINKKRDILPSGRTTVSTGLELLKRVETTLNKISKHVIAVAAFNCGAYNRALMYLEYKNKITDQKDWELLQMIYVQMSVFDGVAGVTASRNTSASLKERIQALETAGKLEETPPMYELGINLFPDDLFFTQGMLKRMLHTGLHSSLLGVVNDRVKDSPELTTHLNEYRVQAAWSLARWDVMEEYLTSTPDATSWSVGVARLFVSARQRDRQTFGSCIKAMRAEQLIPLSTAVMEGGCYERCYENVLNLHMIRDVEEWANSLLFNQTQAISLTDIKAKTNEFESRMAVLQDCWRTKEPAFNLHRALLQLVADQNTQSQVKETLGTCWIKSATLARKEKLIPCCDNALENANLYCPPNFKIEKASWLWDKDVKEEAMTLLMQYLSEIKKSPEGISRRARAEANLIYAKWREATSYYDSEDIRHLFNKVNEIDSDWEEAQFHLANYYYKWSKAVTTGVKQSMLPHVIRHYGESLKYGSNNIFQSMPRLLTTWFELEGAESSYQASQVSSSQAASKPNLVQLANGHIQELIKKLPTYQWLTALSQILSRICHPSPTVTSKLIEIASLILYHYPDQAMWQIYSMTNNSNKERVKHCNEIVKLTLLKYKRAANNGRGIDWFKSFYKDFDRLCRSLLDLSKKDSGSNATLSISRDFRHLKKMLEEPTFTQIILPIQLNTTVTLPVGSCRPQSVHQAFPYHLVTITSLKDEVLVLASLQKPKKITIVGSNGKTYGLLCKPKDDLRKDCRFMEFNMMVNRLLKKDATARKKQLHIRTYAVVPLSENSGLVEWVDNTKLLRNILQLLYAEYKKGMTKHETKSIYNKLMSIKQNPATKMKNGKNLEFIDLFQKNLLPRHPPVLAEWFRRAFPDPSSWFTARQKYTQTTAVISMVGYVVGLGDRHAENIMFDQTTGETVHVDFDCLFEKGESFDWPEKVPFRLTHNMVDAFGVTGVEGTFRISCVDTMRVMRNERDSLLSVLKTFVHDPLIEWAKQDKRGYQVGVDRGRQNLRTDSSSIMKDKAQEIMKMIEKKLNGQVGKHAAAKLPLSTEGQVHKVIRDSTDVGNLSQMYIGWAPYY